MKLNMYVAAACVVAGSAIGAAVTHPTVEASPAFCANHGTGPGQIYKAACANGAGGWGWVDISDTQQEYKSPTGGVKDPSKVRDNNW